MKNKQEFPKCENGNVKFHVQKSKTILFDLKNKEKGISSTINKFIAKKKKEKHTRENIKTNNIEISCC